MTDPLEDCACQDTFTRWIPRVVTLPHAPILRRQPGEYVPSWKMSTRTRVPDMRHGANILQGRRAFGLTGEIPLLDLA